MIDSYDVIVLGSGLKETLITSMLSAQGLKVLQLEKSINLGCEVSPIRLDKLMPSSHISERRQLMIEQEPKFLSTYGYSAAFLAALGISPSLECEKVDSLFCFHKGKIVPVPFSEAQMVQTGLTGLTNKGKLRKFFLFLSQFDESNPSTYGNLRLNEMLFKDVLKHFKIDAESCDFLTYGLGSAENEQFLEHPALPLMSSIRRMLECSICSDQHPYLYPLGGNAALLQRAQQVSLMNGASISVGQTDVRIVCDKKSVLFGVATEGSFIHCSHIVAHPSYARHLCQNNGEIITAVLLLNRVQNHIY
eukprot:MONOS_2648.1-p1 / transcript=MONOS_2648.1 / gene=MONOS_2648 / organism=Monocercomonoides_exilis_PA203 / gene_product=Rab GDP dissociation inhibitor alpha / transcript_product=Rab GDP dissociation inhibitor alpha / location=Mono_scaffold00056:5160-6856(+) / protein_length=304 / sequence_SO=supercontig / SO=protein_coding / is_pseudo=false